MGTVKSVHEWERKYHCRVLNMHPGCQNRKTDYKGFINFIKAENIQLTVDSYSAGKSFIKDISGWDHEDTRREGLSANTLYKKVKRYMGDEWKNREWK